MSVARCTCGSVALRFLRRTPVMHLECGCVDCRQAHEVVASRGGPPTPHPPLQQLLYFANHVAPLSSEELEHVRLTKLRADGRSTRLETTCCHSILAVTHPAYQNNVVMVPSGACDLDAPALSPLARIYMDWDEKADGPPPPLPEGCMLPSADGDKPWRAVMSTPVAQLLDGEAAAALPGEPPGEPVQRLFERLGTGLTVYGHPEGERIRPVVTRTKRVHLLRHGQAMHNPRAEAAREADPPCSFDDFLRLMKEDDAFDAELTELGKEQGRRAAAQPHAAAVDAAVQLVVSSPLSRALNTAMLVLPNATSKGTASFIAHDDLRERSGWLLNAKRRPRAELAAKFPLCDFAPSLLPTEEDTLWTEELEAPEATAERGYRFLRWLAQRPETDIAVVAHGGLFQYLLNSLRPRVVASEAARQRFHNTELRSLSMEWADGAGGDAAPSEQGGEPPRTFKLDVVV